MGIYRRYFSVAESSVAGQVMKLVESSRKVYFSALDELCKEYGAESVHFYNASGKFAGFRFDEAKRDNTLWCKPDKERLVRPRRGTSAGKAIAKRIDALKKPTPTEDVYQAAGLGHGRMLMFSGMTMYNAGLGFYPDPFTLIISVPWKDVDPDELEAYRNDKTTGSGSMDHLLWEVPEGWVEIKEWQATKALEEAKAAA